MSLIFYSFLVRFAQAGMDAALTLVVGAITAGIFRRMIGPASTRRLFGTGVRGLATGWLVGMLLPVCSLGVLPIARELRRSGVPGGAVLAFVLAAPLLNPISFLYGLTLAEPTVILSFVAASLFLSTAAGFLWDRVFAGATSAADWASLIAAVDSQPSPPAGLKRMLAVFVTAVRELAGRDLIYQLIGLASTALLSTAIPFGALQHSMRHADKLSPLLMAALAVPLFSTPLPGMVKIGLMFDHGNSLGAAFVLFAIGIGTSLGTLAWLVVDFGGKRVVLWFATYVLIVVGVGYACEWLLYDHRKSEADHTHAFDDYSRPFPGGLADLPASARRKLAEKFGPLERPAVYGLLGMLAGGAVLRRLDAGGRFERWLTARPPVGTAARKWDVPLPSSVVGGVCLVGLIALSVIGAYVYYPARNECLERMFAVYAEAAFAVNTGKTEEAIRYLELWDQLVRKLEVGTYLRNFGVTPEQAKAAQALREAIEEVRDALRAHHVAAARQKFKAEVGPAYQACKAAYPK